MCSGGRPLDSTASETVVFNGGTLDPVSTAESVELVTAAGVAGSPDSSARPQSGRQTEQRGFCGRFFGQRYQSRGAAASALITPQPRSPGIATAGPPRRTIGISAPRGAQETRVSVAPQQLRRLICGPKPAWLSALAVVASTSEIRTRT
jgi:hypothetical protein